MRARGTCLKKTRAVRVLEYGAVVVDEGEGVTLGDEEGVVRASVAEIVPQRRHAQREAIEGGENRLV